MSEQVAEPRNVVTPNLGLNQPDIGGDVDGWGDLLNQNFSVLDGVLPVTGGQMTGPFTSATGGIVGPMIATDIYQNPNSWAFSNAPITIRADPYGYYDTGTLLSVVATGLPLSSSRAGIAGGWEQGVSAIAQYGFLDEINIYSGVLSHTPPLVLHNVTYDATHVYPQTPLTAAQIAVLRKNMYVITNSIDSTVSATPSVPNGYKPENHYASFVTGWAADGSSITVVGWTVPGSGHTAAGQVPSATLETAWSANATAYFGAPTNIGNGNFVAQHQPTQFPDSRTRLYTGIEFDFQNWDTNNYTMFFNGITIVYSPINGAAPTADSCGMIINGGGKLPTGLLIAGVNYQIKTDPFSAFNNSSPPPWAGSPVRSVTAAFSNYIDGNNLQLLLYTTRDTGASGGGWPTASTHLQLWIDGQPIGNMANGSPMAQLVWNPQGYAGGMQFQTAAGIPGLTMDDNGVLYTKQLNIGGVLYPQSMATAALPTAGGAGGLLEVTDAINPITNTVTGPLLVKYMFDNTWRTVGTNQIPQTTPYTTIQLGPNLSVDSSGRVTLGADPATALQAATKQYVDAHAGGGGGGGTVTSITAGIGLTGGNITTSGTIALGNTAVAAGPYTNANITVNAQGQLTAASSGAAPPGPATVAPVMNSIAAVGTSLLYARQDHVHGSDTSRMAVGATAAGDLTGTYPNPTLLATVNGNVGSFTYASLTVNAKGLVTAASSGAAPPGPATVAPLMDTTTAAVGASLLYARQDHQHPTDTTRAPLASPTFTGTATAADFTLTDATAPLILYSANGAGLPTFTTRSVGTKIVLYPNLSSTLADFAIGIAANTLWNSVQSASTGTFQWYGGTTLAATLTGTGAMTLVGQLTAGEVQAQQSGWGGTIFSTYTGAGSSMGFYNGGGTLNFGTCDASGNWQTTYMSLSTTTGLNLTGAVSMPLSAAKTGTAYTVAATDYSLNLAPTGTFTLTLPAASSSSGRILNLKLTAAFAVNSASANVVPLAGGSASTAIMTATVGKYCELQSDGTNWQIMQAN